MAADAGGAGGGGATVRVMSPEEIIARGHAAAAFLQWPSRESLFAERALRLRQLAAGHAMRDFLIFMADLADAQHHELQCAADVPLPDAAARAHAAGRGVPPVPADTWPRDPMWIAGLHAIVQRLAPRAPQAARPALQRLAALPNDEIERQADRLLHGVMLGLDFATAPLVAAGLQVYWTRLLLGLQQTVPDAIGRIDDPFACPCCGSRPTASITRLATDAPGQRYLHCSLCSLQWHLERIRCSHCSGTQNLSYQALQPIAGEAPGPSSTALQAETCDDCGHYLKIVHMEKDPHVDPAADDLASVTLDLLLADAGRQRHGVNLMLLFGDPDSPAPDTGGSG